VSTVASYRHEIAERSRADGSATEIGAIGRVRETHAPNGGVTDSLDEAKAAFRAAWEAGGGALV
jgi:hypothetical protein